MRQESFTARQLIQKIRLDSPKQQTQPRIKPFYIPMQISEQANKQFFHSKHANFNNTFHTSTRSPNKPKALNFSQQAKKDKNKAIRQENQHKISQFNNLESIQKEQRSNQYQSFHINSRQITNIRNNTQTADFRNTSQQAVAERNNQAKFMIKSTEIVQKRFTDQIRSISNQNAFQIPTNINRRTINVPQFKTDDIKGNGYLQNQQNNNNYIQQISNQQKNKHFKLRVCSGVFSEAFICRYQKFDPRYYLKVIQHLQCVRQAQTQEIFTILSQIKSLVNKSIFK